MSCIKASEDAVAAPPISLLDLPYEIRRLIYLHLGVDTSSNLREKQAVATWQDYRTSAVAYGQVMRLRSLRNGAGTMAERLALNLQLDDPDGPSFPLRTAYFDSRLGFDLTLPLALLLVNRQIHDEAISETFLRSTLRLDCGRHDLEFIKEWRMKPSWRVILDQLFSKNRAVLSRSRILQHPMIGNLRRISVRHKVSVTPIRRLSSKFMAECNEKSSHGSVTRYTKCKPIQWVRFIEQLPGLASVEILLYVFICNTKEVIEDPYYYGSKYAERCLAMQDDPILRLVRKMRRNANAPQIDVTVADYRIAVPNDHKHINPRDIEVDPRRGLRLSFAGLMPAGHTLWWPALAVYLLRERRYGFKVRLFWRSEVDEMVANTLGRRQRIPANPKADFLENTRPRGPPEEDETTEADRVIYSDDAADGKFRRLSETAQPGGTYNEPSWLGTFPLGPIRGWQIPK